MPGNQRVTTINQNKQFYKKKNIIIVKNIFILFDVKYVITIN